jgi:hypothetical protein
MRFKVPLEKSPNFYETFTIELNDINSKGEAFLKILWENTMVKIPVKSKEDDTIVALIDQHIIKGKLRMPIYYFRQLIIITVLIEIINKQLYGFWKQKK